MAKKKRKTTKTIKQIRVAKLVSENIRNKNPKSLGNIILEAGYSETVAKSPQRVTESTGYREMMKKFFPESYRQKKHKSLLEAKTMQQANFYYKIKDEEIKEMVEAQGWRFIGTKRFMTTAVVFFAMPDTITQDRALDKLYKITGDYAPEKHQTIDPLEGMGLEDLEQAIEEKRGLIDRYKKYPGPKKKAKK
jgi:hypothetical protein